RVADVVTLGDLCAIAVRKHSALCFFNLLAKLELRFRGGAEVTLNGDIIRCGAGLDRRRAQVSRRLLGVLVLPGRTLGPRATGEKAGGWHGGRHGDEWAVAHSKTSKSSGGTSHTVVFAFALAEKLLRLCRRTREVCCIPSVACARE